MKARMKRDQAKQAPLDSGIEIEVEGETEEEKRVVRMLDLGYPVGRGYPAGDLGWVVLKFKSDAYVPGKKEMERALKG